MGWYMVYGVYIYIFPDISQQWGAKQLLGVSQAV